MFRISSDSSKFVQTYFSMCNHLYHCHVDCPRLSHWGRVTHICVAKPTIIGSDNGLSPGRRQAIIWTNAGILLIRPLGTNFSEISIGTQTFSFKKMHLKISSAKWHPFLPNGIHFCQMASIFLGLNVLTMFFTHQSLNKPLLCFALLTRASVIIAVG